MSPQTPARVNRTDAPGALLTPSEVASMFRVDPKTVTRWAKAGKLPAIRTLGGHRRYSEAQVRRLLTGIPQPRDTEVCPPQPRRAAARPRAPAARSSRHTRTWAPGAIRGLTRVLGPRAPPATGCVGGGAGRGAISQVSGDDEGPRPCPDGALRVVPETGL